MKRLNKLTTRLDENRELLKNWNDIFQEQLQAGMIGEVHDKGDSRNVTDLRFQHKEVVKCYKIWYFPYRTVFKSGTLQFIIITQSLSHFQEIQKRHIYEQVLMKEIEI